MSLLAAPAAGDAPEGLRVETSQDGQRWETAAVDGDVLAGLHWWEGHPRIDDSGRVIVRFAPRIGRYLRLTGDRDAAPERMVEPLGALRVRGRGLAGEAAGAASTALGVAMRTLDHWMDDPTGPHPLRAPATAEHRRAQVPWGAVFAAANAALASDPEWEEAHHVYAWALARSGWGHGLDWLLDQARRAGAWQEVARLSELLTAEPDAAWRAHRQQAWAEALVHLGRSAEAAALRARPSRSRAAHPDPLRSGAPARGHRRPDPGTTGRHRAPGVSLAPLTPTAYDYWVFLHVVGLPGGGNHDRIVGAYGSSRWSPGERVAQTVTFSCRRTRRPGIPAPRGRVAALHGAPAVPPDYGRPAGAPRRRYRHARRHARPRRRPPVPAAGALRARAR